VYITNVHSEFVIITVNTRLIIINSIRRDPFIDDPVLSRVIGEADLWRNAGLAQVGGVGSARLQSDRAAVCKGSCAVIFTSFGTRKRGAFDLRRRLVIS